jgi:peptide/nickel transport system permease protein
MRRKLVVVCFLTILVYLFVAFLGAIGWLPDYQERVASGYEVPSIWLTLCELFGTLTPEEIKMKEATAAASTYWDKILGTDIFGRSVIYKLLAGTKTAMIIGFLVTGIAIPVGVVLGGLSGFFGGKVDAFVVWLYTVIVSVPYILMVIAISYVLGKGMFAICVAMGSLWWVSTCRLTRGEFLKHKDREYVLASRLLGASDSQIIFKHILPNVLHLPIITGSLLVLGAIKSEVILTFLGVGIQDGASWGTMIDDAKGELVQGIWWPLTGTVIAMFFIIYALNVVGDALRDALDPKLLD